jgi:hypothetical protein
MVALLAEHRQLDLSSFDLAPRTGWSAAVQLSFNKRKFLYEKIKQQAAVLQGGDKLDRAARLLDERRGSLSVSKFYTTLRNNSPSKKTRKRRHD